MGRFSSFKKSSHFYHKIFIKDCFNSAEKAHLKLLWRLCSWQWSGRKEGCRSAARQGWPGPFAATQRAAPPWFAQCCCGTGRSPPSWSEEICHRILFRNREMTNEDEVMSADFLRRAGGRCRCSLRTVWSETAAWSSGCCATSRCWRGNSRRFPSPFRVDRPRTDVTNVKS